MTKLDEIREELEYFGCVPLKTQIGIPWCNPKCPQVTSNGRPMELYRCRPDSEICHPFLKKMIEVLNHE